MHVTETACDVQSRQLIKNCREIHLPTHEITSVMRYCAMLFVCITRSYDTMRCRLESFSVMRYREMSLRCCIQGHFSRYVCCCTALP